jgi:hypothetical protein
MDAQTKAFDKQTKQLRLQQLALYEGGTNKRGELKGGAKRQYDALQRQIDEASRRSEAVSLRKSLTYDDQLEKIKLAATGGAPKEMTGPEAEAEAKKEYANYQRLTKAIEAQEKTLEASQEAMESVTAATGGINEALKALQKQREDELRILDAQKQGYEDANDGIDNQVDALKKLGPAGQTAAKLMEDAAKREKKALEDFGRGIITEENKDIEAMVKRYKDAFDQIQVWARLAYDNIQNGKAPGSGPTPLLPTIPGAPTSTGSSGQVGRAAGGPVSPGGRYRMEGRDWEVFVPHSAGAIYSMAQGGNGGGQAAPSINVTGPIASIQVVAGGDGRLAQAAVDQVRQIIKSAWDETLDNTIRSRVRVPLGYTSRN